MEFRTLSNSILSTFGYNSRSLSLSDHPFSIQFISLKLHPAKILPNSSIPQKITHQTIPNLNPQTPTAQTSQTNCPPSWSPFAACVAAHKIQSQIVCRVPCTHANEITQRCRCADYNRYTMCSCHTDGHFGVDLSSCVRPCMR